MRRVLGERKGLRTALAGPVLLSFVRAAGVVPLSRYGEVVRLPGAVPPASSWNRFAVQGREAREVIPHSGQSALGARPARLYPHAAQMPVSARRRARTPEWRRNAAGVQRRRGMGQRSTRAYQKPVATSPDVHTIARERCCAPYAVISSFQPSHVSQPGDSFGVANARVVIYGVAILSEPFAISNEDVRTTKKTTHHRDVIHTAATSMPRVRRGQPSVLRLRPMRVGGCDFFTGTVSQLGLRSSMRV